VRRTRRDDARSRGQEEIALRQAVRLVIEELGEAKTTIEQAVSSRTWWKPPRQLSTGTYSEYRHVLAGQFGSPITWSVVSSAYDVMNRLNWKSRERWEAAELRNHQRSASAAQTHDPQLGRIWPTDATRDGWRTVRVAIGALESEIDLMGPASRMLGEVCDQENALWPHGDGDEFTGTEDEWYGRV
jgi:hypothetical protein